jgi:hypothetical protein
LLEQDIAFSYDFFWFLFVGDVISGNFPGEWSLIGTIGESHGRQQCSDRTYINDPFEL